MSKKQQQLIELKNDVATYFDSFGVWIIFLKSFKKVIDNGIIKPIFKKMQAYYSKMCKYFCSVHVNFILRNKRLSVFTNSFSENNFNENDQLIPRFY